MSTDDLALAVDGAVARVAKRDEQMGGFIGLYFDAKWPALRIARAHKRRKAKAYNLALAAQLYEQAAKECDDMYVNRKIEPNKPLGSQADQQHAVAEYTLEPHENVPITPSYDPLAKLTPKQANIYV